jgi:hypothetical protein
LEEKVGRQSKEKQDVKKDHDDGDGGDDKFVLRGLTILIFITLYNDFFPATKVILSRAKLKHRASPLERTTPALKWKY